MSGVPCQEYRCGPSALSTDSSTQYSHIASQYAALSLPVEKYLVTIITETYEGCFHECIKYIYFVVLNVDVRRRRTPQQHLQYFVVVVLASLVNRCHAVRGLKVRLAKESGKYFSLLDITPKKKNDTTKEKMSILCILWHRLLAARRPIPDDYTLRPDAERSRRCLLPCNSDPLLLSKCAHYFLSRPQKKKRDQYLYEFLHLFEIAFH